MSVPPPASPTRSRRPRRARILPRTFRQWLAALAIVVLLVVVVSYCLARMTPSWYRPLDPNAQSVIDLADSAQNKLELHNTLERVPLGERSWTITQDELNAMIAIKRGELPVSNPMVIFTPGKITLAARVKEIPGSNPAGGVGSIVLAVEIIPAASPLESPSGVVKIDSAWMGNLPVPKSLVESRIPDLTPRLVAAARQALALHMGSASKMIGEVERAILAVSRGEHFPVCFTYDRRPIVVKEVRVGEGWLTIVFAPPTPAVVGPRPAFVPPVR